MAPAHVAVTRARTAPDRRAAAGLAACDSASNITASVRPISCQPTGCRDRIHAGLLAGDSDRSRRHSLARHAATRRGDAGVDAAHVAEARARSRSCRRDRCATRAARSTSSGVQPANSATAARSGPSSPPYRTAIRRAARQRPWRHRPAAVALLPERRAPARRDRSAADRSECRPCSTTARRHARRGPGARAAGAARWMALRVDHRIHQRFQLDEHHRVARQPDLHASAASSFP